MESQRETKLIRKEKIINQIFSEIEENNDYTFCLQRHNKDFYCCIRDAIVKEKVYRNSKLTRNSFISRLGINKDLFIKNFQQCFNMSFRSFINRIRIREAIILLEQSDLTIREIAQKVGFGSIRTFQRQFMSAYSMSPKRYRKAQTF